MFVDLGGLREPFPAADIEWRVGQSGVSKSGSVWCKVLAYLTNRAIMDRLDAVCGPEAWRNEFRQIEGGFLCGISIRCYPDGTANDPEWVTKWDGADRTDIEAIKGGLSGSMKRAAVQWGIGRYLYDLEEGFARVGMERAEGWNYAKTKEGAVFYWQPPALPSWALPKGAQSQAEPARNYAQEFKERAQRMGYEGKMSPLCAALAGREVGELVASHYAEALKQSAAEWQRAMDGLEAERHEAVGV